MKVYLHVPIVVIFVAGRLASGSVDEKVEALAHTSVPGLLRYLSRHRRATALACSTFACGSQWSFPGRKCRGFLCIYEAPAFAPRATQLTPMCRLLSMPCGPATRCDNGDGDLAITQKSRHAGVCESFDFFIDIPAGQADSYQITL